MRIQLTRTSLEAGGTLDVSDSNHGSVGKPDTDSICTWSPSLLDVPRALVSVRPRQLVLYPGPFGSIPQVAALNANQSSSIINTTSQGSSCLPRQMK